MKNPDDHVYFPPGFPRDPNRPAYSEDGVDLTLIRWMLSLTPLERLRKLEAFISDVERIESLNQGARRGR